VSIFVVEVKHDTVVDAVVVVDVDVDVPKNIIIVIIMTLERNTSDRNRCILDDIASFLMIRMVFLNTKIDATGLSIVYVSFLVQGCFVVYSVGTV